MPKLLESRGNGLTSITKGYTSAGKSVSHPLIHSVRFVQVELRGNRSVRVSKQIESAMRKGGHVHCKSVDRSDSIT